MLDALCQVMPCFLIFVKRLAQTCQHRRRPDDSALRQWFCTRDSVLSILSYDVSPLGVDLASRFGTREFVSSRKST